MITLVLGGARSGKSTFAENLAVQDSLRQSGTVTYIATADPGDPEMEARIALHKARRPDNWKTWEGKIAALPDEIAHMQGILLLDCLTMYLTGLFLASPLAESDDETGWIEAEKEILRSLEQIYRNVSQTKTGSENHLIVVSNEVGFGLVPPYRLGRRFRDMQGRANQLTARHADNVALVVAGLPLWVKGHLPIGE